MKKIGVLGANGQVGMEVCLILNNMPDVQVIGICRNKLASAVLRRLGIECRHGSINNQNEVKSLLGGLDIVVDFILPSGTLQELLDSYKSIVSSVISNIDAGTKYVFISSQMAFGQSDLRKKQKHFILPGTFYAFTLRFAEKFAQKLGRSKNVDVFALRLGQVHGLLQGISSHMSSLASADGKKFVVPNGPSYAIFCYNIAEALVNIANGIEKPGLYVLDNSPGFTWERVLQFYNIEPSRIIAQNPSVFFGKQRKGIKQLLSPIVAFASKNREIALIQLFRFFPDLELKLKAKHRTASARKQYGEIIGKSDTHKFDFFSGVLPGQRMSSLKGQEDEFRKMNLICQSKLDNLI